MKKCLLICVAAQVFTACNSQPTQPSSPSATNKQNNFAVVELFTSQGCSSCPSADALLGKEIAAFNQEGKKLIALSFHVDYWNRLGWTDPYSQHIFTERQYAYSSKLKLNGAYTPQAVVNGQWETVGSKQGTIENFMKQSFAQKAISTITLVVVNQKGKNLEITYQYKGGNADLNIAIVQNTISTPVKAGENEGRTLTSCNVVRSWKTVDAHTGSGNVKIEIPVGYTAKDYSVIVYAQEKGYGKIIAADRK